MVLSYICDLFWENVGNDCCTWTICDLSSTRDTSGSAVQLCPCTCLVFCLYCWSGAITLSCIVFSAIDKTEKACKIWVVIKDIRHSQGGPSVFGALFRTVYHTVQMSAVMQYSKLAFQNPGKVQPRWNEKNDADDFKKCIISWPLNSTTCQKSNAPN